jgi:hypothetical protein
LESSLLTPRDVRGPRPYAALGRQLAATYSAHHESPEPQEYRAAVAVPAVQSHLPHWPRLRHGHRGHGPDPSKSTARGASLPNLWPRLVVEASRGDPEVTGPPALEEGQPIGTPATIQRYYRLAAVPPFAYHRARRAGPGLATSGRGRWPGDGV